MHFHVASAVQQFAHRNVPVNKATKLSFLLYAVMLEGLSSVFL